MTKIGKGKESDPTDALVDTPLTHHHRHTTDASVDSRPNVGRLSTDVLANTSADALVGSDSLPLPQNLRFCYLNYDLTKNSMAHL